MKLPTKDILDIARNQGPIGLTGVELDWIDKETGMTPLAQAIDNRDWIAVIGLIYANADCTIQSPKGSALMMIVKKVLEKEERNKYQYILELMILSKINYKTITESPNPLEIILSRPYSQHSSLIAKKLIDAGADLGEHNKSYALFYAIENGFLEIVELFLNVDPGCILKRNAFDWSVFLSAITYKQTAIFEVLLEHARKYFKDPTKYKHIIKQIIFELVRQPKPDVGMLNNIMPFVNLEMLNAKTAKGEPLLLSALIKECESQFISEIPAFYLMIRTLIEGGADIDSKTLSGEGFLDIIQRFCKHLREALIAAGVDVGKEQEDIKIFMEMSQAYLKLTREKIKKMEEQIQKAEVTISDLGFKRRLLDDSICESRPLLFVPDDLLLVGPETHLLVEPKTFSLCAPEELSLVKADTHLNTERKIIAEDKKMTSEVKTIDEKIQFFKDQSWGLERQIDEFRVHIKKIDSLREYYTNFQELYSVSKIIAEFHLREFADTATTADIKNKVEELREKEIIKNENLALALKNALTRMKETATLKRLKIKPLNEMNVDESPKTPKSASKAPPTVETKADAENEMKKSAEHVVRQITPIGGIEGLRPERVFPKADVKLSSFTYDDLFEDNILYEKTLSREEAVKYGNRRPQIPDWMKKDITFNDSTLQDIERALKLAQVDKISTYGLEESPIYKGTTDLVVENHESFMRMYQTTISHKGPAGTLLSAERLKRRLLSRKT